jgi:hypothetical protein
VSRLFATLIVTLAEKNSQKVKDNHKEALYNISSHPYRKQAQTETLTISKPL